MQNFDQSKLKKVETNEKSILSQEKSRVLADKTNIPNNVQNKISDILKKLLEAQDDQNECPAKVFLRLPSKTRQNDDYYKKIFYPISFEEITFSNKNGEYKSILEFTKGQGSTN